MPELPVGQQEQELRQLLNKDKSKRSKNGGLSGWWTWPPAWACEGRVGVTPARYPSACWALPVNAGGSGHGGC